MMDEHWFIEVQIDQGKKGWFFLSTLQVKSVISPKWLESPGSGNTHEFSLDGVSVGKAEVVMSEIPGHSTVEDVPVAGMLGLDILARIGFGLDALTGETQCWVGGQVPAGEAAAWIGAPGGKAKMTAVPLVAAAPYVGVKTSIGPKAATLVLDLGAPNAFLSADVAGKATRAELWKVAVQGVDEASRLYVTDSLSLPGLPKWLLYHSAADAFTGANIEPPDGTLSRCDIPSQRCILDIPAKQLDVQTLSSEETLSYIASRLLAVPVTVSGDYVSIGPLGVDVMSKYLKEHNCDGRGVDTVAGRPAKDFVRAIRAASNSGLNALGDWVPILAKTLKISILRPGTPFNLTINKET